MTKTDLMRVRRETKRKLRKALPGLSDADRIDLTFNTSAVRMEGILKDKDFANKLGTFIYGKKVWKKR